MVLQWRQGLTGEGLGTTDLQPLSLCSRARESQLPKPLCSATGKATSVTGRIGGGAGAVGEQAAGPEASVPAGCGATSGQLGAVRFGGGGCEPLPSFHWPAIPSGCQRQRPGQGYIVLHKINFPSEIPRHAMSQTAVGCKCSDL